MAATIHENMWDSTQAMVWEKQMALCAKIRKEERLRMNELGVQLTRVEGSRSFRETPKEAEENDEMVGRNEWNRK